MISRAGVHRDIVREPLQRVFDMSLRPDPTSRSLPLQSPGISPDKITYRPQIGDAIEGASTRRWSGRSRSRRDGAARPHRQRAPVPRLRGARRAVCWWSPDERCSYVAAPSDRQRDGRGTAGGRPHPPGARTSEGRGGGGVLQPWRDMGKQLGKQQITRRERRWCSRPHRRSSPGRRADRRDRAAGRHRVPAWMPAPTCSPSSGCFRGHGRVDPGRHRHRHLVRRHGRQP